MSSEVSSRRLFAATMLLVLAFTSLTQIGCTQPIRRLGIIDELAITYRDAVWAKRAYNLRFANCNREYSDHFQNGFCAGYSDMCNGGDGYLPALPPEEYRGYEYQCAEGAKCIDTWFDGFPAGVAAAREEQAGKFHEMHISRMIGQAVTQSKAPKVLPSDVPVAKPSSTLLQSTSTAFRKLGKSGLKPPARFAAMKMPAPSSARTVTRTAMPVPTPKAPVRSVLAKPAPPKTQVKEAPKTQVKVAPKTQVKETSTLPPIIKAPKTVEPVQQTPVAKPAANGTLPPIVQASKSVASTQERPPIVRGRKIDPSATVSNSEIPLPMAVRSSFDTRTAAWPVNRK